MIVVTVFSFLLLYITYFYYFCTLLHNFINNTKAIPCAAGTLIAISCMYAKMYENVFVF